MITSTFSHIALSCKDPVAIERFYSRYFGFQRARVVPLGKEQVVFMKAGGVYLELFVAHASSPLPPARGAGPEYPAFRHIAFTVDDVDAKLAEMEGEVQVTLGPTSFDDIIPDWRTAWISDPEGNIVEITHGYIDQEDPPPYP